MSPAEPPIGWSLTWQRGVLTRAQAVAAGLTPNALQYRLRPGGPWQRLLPGVYLTTTGRPTDEQIRIASVLYAGPDSLITGTTALANYQIRAPRSRQVDVLVPVASKRSSCWLVAVHRTRRMPMTVTCDGPVRFAPPERAVADAVRFLAARAGADEARAIVASAVQQDRCTVEELVAEVSAGPVRGSANLRALLAEVIDGIRSVPEAELRRLISRSGLPQPLYNPKLYLGNAFLAQPDAWWPQFGVAVEVDSRQWHLSPADWEQTMARSRRMTAAGILVVHLSPRQLRDQGRQVVADVAAALRAGRPLPAITTRPLPAITTRPLPAITTRPLTG